MCLSYSQQKVDLAEEQYRRAIDLQWKSPDAHYHLGCLLQHERNDMLGAESQYRLAVKHDPRCSVAHYNLGWLLEKVDGILPPCATTIEGHARQRKRTY